MNYYNEIKTKLIENETYAKIKDYSKEKYKLNTYYEVRKILSEAGKQYGEGIIKEYSNKLTQELGRGYNTTSLKRMRQFYLCIQKGATLWHQLTWSHYKILITIDKIEKIEYYSKTSVQNNNSVRELEKRIKNKEYERLDKSAKLKLINQEKLTIQDNIKNPIILHSSKQE